jgi:hypothetical protein
VTVKSSGKVSELKLGKRNKCKQNFEKILVQKFLSLIFLLFSLAIIYNLIKVEQKITHGDSEQSLRKILQSSKGEVSGKGRKIIFRGTS